MTSPVENEFSGSLGSVQPTVTFATCGSGFVVTSSSNVISSSSPLQQLAISQPPASASVSDDVMFSYHRANWARIKHDVIFRRSSPGGGSSWTPDNYSVCTIRKSSVEFSSGDKVCHLRLRCYSRTDHILLARIACAANSGRCELFLRLS